MLGVREVLVEVAEAEWKKDESGSEKTEEVSMDIGRLPLLGPRDSADQGAGEEVDAESVRRPLVKREE